jgi:hypothetical protein
VSAVQAGDWRENAGGDRRVSFDVWGRTSLGQSRKRLSKTFKTEAEARTAMRKLKAKGFIDVVIAQRPVRYGNVKGLQRKGRT